MTIFSWFKLILLWLSRRAKNCKILGIDSNFDQATKWGWNYRNKNVYPRSILCGYHPLLAQENNANRDFVVSLLNSHQKVLYITGVGHGSYIKYTGQNICEVFKVGNYNPSEVKDKVIHLLSCQCARDLGPDFVRNGCKAFFGYIKNFTLLAGFTTIILHCDTVIDYYFLNGNIAEQVYVLTKEVYSDALNTLRRQWHFYPAAVLKQNWNYLRCPTSDAKWGDKTAHIRIR